MFLPPRKCEDSEDLSARFGAPPEEMLAFKIRLLDIGPGDYLEFGNIGAYSIGGRTDYNGFYSDRIVTMTSADEFPPLVADQSADGIKARN